MEHTEHIDDHRDDWKGDPKEKVQVEGKNKKFMTNALEKEKRKNSVDHMIWSVAFSTDGKLALGYKGGGVNILSSYKSYDMGMLEGIQISDFGYVCNLYQILLCYFSFGTIFPILLSHFK